jgi:hypothetical protein
MISARVYVDVSDLAPPEPLALALEAAEGLMTGQFLHIHHWREPLLLYERLDGRGFSYDVRLGEDDACEIFIWRSSDQASADAAGLYASKLPMWPDQG